MYRSSGINDQLAGREVMADGGYRGNHEVIMPYRQPRDGSELPTCEQDYNAGHRKVRARVEHALARLKTYKILRDYRRAARTLAVVASGITHLNNIALTGRPANRSRATLASNYETSFGRCPVQPTRRQSYLHRGLVRRGDTPGAKPKRCAPAGSATTTVCSPAVTDRTSCGYAAPAEDGPTWTRPPQRSFRTRRQGSRPRPAGSARHVRSAGAEFLAQASDP